MKVAKILPIFKKKVKRKMQQIIDQSQSFPLSQIESVQENFPQ